MLLASKNKKENINEAAYKVLLKWLQGWCQRKTAYVKLGAGSSWWWFINDVTDVFRNKCTDGKGQYVLNVIGHFSILHLDWDILRVMQIQSGSKDSHFLL